MSLAALKDQSAAKTKLAQLRASYARLSAARDAFTAAVMADYALPAWCEGERTDEASRTAAVSIFGTYESAIDTIAVRRHCGVIGCSQKTIRHAVAFNRAKTAFQASLQDVRPWTVTAPGQGRKSLLRLGLESLGIPQLNTIEAIRRVVVLPRGVVRVGWSWARKPRIKKTTREQVLSSIDSMSASKQESLRVAKLRIQSLRSGTQLVRYRDGQLTLIANIATLNKWNKRTNQQVSGGLPLLVPLSPGDKLPEYQAPRKGHTRRPRDVDRQIEDVDFVPELRLRRYFNPYNRR